MVPLFEHYCAFGAGGAAPSIDTAMRSWRPATSTTCTSARSSPARPGRRGPREGMLRPGGGLGAVASSRLRARAADRRAATGQPGLAWRGARGSRVDHVGGHVGGLREDLVGGDPSGRRFIAESGGADPFGPVRRSFRGSRWPMRSAARWRRTSRRCSAGCARAIGARWAAMTTALSCSTSSPGRPSRLARSASCPTTSSDPDPAAPARRAAVGGPRRRHGPAPGAAGAVPGRLRGLLPPVRRARGHHRCGARTR